MLINVRDEDKDKLSVALIENNFTPTLIASTGEFLHFGKSIFLLGIEDERVDEAIDIINRYTNSIKEVENKQGSNEWYVLNTKMIQK